MFGVGIGNVSTMQVLAIAWAACGLAAFATHLTRTTPDRERAPGELMIQFVGAAVLGVIALISVFTSKDT